MRKKYLSALLFGALLMTSAGTFTSCKDYDDEINNLQEQVDKLATKEDMEAKLSQMQAAIDAAKKTAEDALAKAESIEGGVDNSEEVAKLTERVAALEEAMKKVETLKEEIKSMVDDQLADFRVEMEEFMKEVEELTGYSLTMATGVSFVYPDNLLNVNYARVENIYVPNANYYDQFGNVNDNQDTKGNKFDTKTSYTFGAGFSGEFTVNSKDVNTVVDDLLVKVDPVNAVISSDMITLINGKGENIDSYLEYSASPWSGNISTRNSSTGLYKVGVKLKKDVDFEAFDKMVLPTPGNHTGNNCDNNHGYNLFALGINDTDKSRLVTSDYAVSLHVQEETEAKGIYNSELVSSAKTSPIYKHAIADNNDDKCFEIVLGEPFDVNIFSEGGRVMASYVVVDENHKSLSTTDKVAIKALSFSGVKTVSRELKHSITVSGEAGVAVPMKLVTIDYTGVVKENIFWVKASTPALMTAEFTMTPTTFVDNGQAWDASSIKSEDRDKQAFKIPAGTTTYTIDLVAGEEYGEKPFNDFSQYSGTMSLNGNVLKCNNSNILELYKADKSSKPANINEVAYASFVGTLNLQGMREDKTYTGVIKFFNGDNYLGSNTITVTKKLPTDVPADFSAKTNAINNGVLTIYPEPNKENNYGEYSLIKSFNHFEVSGSNQLGYSYNIDKVTPNKAKFDGNLTSLLNIDPSIIDSKTEYASAITYNYGDIKFVPTGHGVDADANHTVEWSTKFATKFGWWALDCVYNWTEEPVVYYRETNIIKGKVTKDANGKVTAFDNVISVKTPYGGIADPFDATDADWTTWTKALDENVTITLYTMNNGTKVPNEFFTAKFDVVEEEGIKKYAMVLTPVSKEVQLSGDVETEVVLEFKDEFKKDCKVSALKFTMKKDHK